MPEKRLVIAIDCDDVLVPTSQSLVNDYNRRFGTQLGLEHMYTSVSLDGWGTESEDEAISRVGEFLRSEEHANIPPDPEAVFAVRALATKHELHLVTGRASFLEGVTQRMLERYFKDCFKTVEHTNYMSLSDAKTATRTKGEVCSNLGADILIDDHIAHGESVREANLSEVIVFGNYPWNQRDVLPNGMVRCEDWPAVMEYLNEQATI